MKEIQVKASSKLEAHYNLKNSVSNWMDYELKHFNTKKGIATYVEMEYDDILSEKEKEIIGMAFSPKPKSRHKRKALI